MCTCGQVAHCLWILQMLKDPWFEWLIFNFSFQLISHFNHFMWHSGINIAFYKFNFINHGLKCWFESLRLNLRRTLYYLRVWGQIDDNSNFKGPNVQKGELHHCWPSFQFAIERICDNDFGRDRVTEWCGGDWWGRRQRQGDLVVEELDADMNHGGDELGHNRDLTTTVMEE